VRAVQAPISFPLQWPGPEEQVDDQQALLLHGTRYIGLRTRLYDDYLQAAVEAGVPQVVLLAVGLDTRAFRLPWPDQVRCSNLIGLRCCLQRRRAAAGRGVGAMRPQAGRGGPVGAVDRAATGSRLGQHDPTAWLAEGLLAYLPAQAEQSLLQRIDELWALGSQLALDGSPTSTAVRTRPPWSKLSARSGMGEQDMISTQERPDLLAWLQHGWRADERLAQDLVGQYRRELTDPFGRYATRRGCTPAS